MIDLYRVLGIRKNASAATIERAYRRKAKETHPDRGGSADAFGQVDLAYRVLSDSTARAHYDATGEATPPAHDNSMADVSPILLGLLAAVLKGFAAQGRTPKDFDVCGEMRKAIDEQRKEPKKKQADLTKARADLVEAQSRFEAEGGENLLAGLAQIHISQIDGMLAELAKGLGLLDKAGEILKRHKYRFDAKMFQPGSWRNGATTFGNSFFLLNGSV